MKKLHLLIMSFLFLQMNVYSQIPVVQEIIDLVSQDSLMHYVRELSGDIPTIINGEYQSISSRNRLQPGNELARIYIKQKFESYGLSPTIQTFSSMGQNVLAVQPGVEYPNVKYIICAHYDDMPEGTVAPGADDNASGVAAVIEAARILSQYSFPMTIVYAAWDEEEYGIMGSYYYAQQASIAGDSILGVINVDMISYDSNSDYSGSLQVRPINYSLYMRDKVMEVNALYNIGMNLYSVNPGVTTSDHSAFWFYNYAAIYLAENGGDSNPFYHTVNDLVSSINPQYLYRYTKLSLGVMAELSLASFYNNIIAIDPYTDKSYAVKSVDSVLFLTRFMNLMGHPFTANLIFSNNNHTQVDSVVLFDDGMHGDSLANDGIFGAYIPPQQNENFYTLEVSSVDNQTSKYFLTQDLTRYTTAGPVVWDDVTVEVYSNSRYLIRPLIKNESESQTFNYLWVKPHTEDTLVTNILPEFRTIPPISPGEINSVEPFAVYHDPSDTLGLINFRYEISLDGWTYWSGVKQVDFSVVSIDEENYDQLTFNLEQNYPNPFNPGTKIKYTVPQFSQVQIKVYDVLGNEIETLISEEKAAGTYELTWNAANLPSGVYFYQIRAGEFTGTRKMILLK